ncbi:HET-domain-containing protein, partial [Colletotrichum sublineola]
MSFSDDRLCRNCTKLDLQAIFNPDRFNGLPPIGSAQSYKTGWTEYVQHVGNWRPLTREERIGHYPPGIIPSCPFCDLVFSIGFNLDRYPMAEKEKVILAIPANLPYNLAVIDKGTSAERLSTGTSVFLLIMNPSKYNTLSAQYYGNTRTGGGWLTAWIRFAHREAPGSLISISSTAVLEPPQPLLDLPMQVRVLREESIDFGLIRSWIHLCEHHHDTYNLPPVIQDAMRATIKLGFRYIWIDRYCIWQDDSTHKMSQVERMDQIYGDAQLSIIAIGAKDPSYGL